LINKIIKIWENNSLGSKKITFEPTLETFILAGDEKRGAVLICPGGGYEYTSKREGEPVALQFNSAGYHAFVLDYSVAPNKHPQPLLDLSRAICIIRENADKWKLDPQKIAVCGFSAGGHLAASLGVHWQKSYLDIPGIEIGMNAPNALILSYPVITAGEFAHQGSFNNLLGAKPEPEVLQEMSLETQVNKDLPPTFIWHTLEDRSVPVENSLLFIQQLRKKKVPFEFHLYPKGPHGLSLATKETDNGEIGTYPRVATWMKLCIGWLKEVFE
jgi:acetyl esterase/lipase